MYVANLCLFYLNDMLKDVFPPCILLSLSGHLLLMLPNHNPLENMDGPFGHYFKINSVSLSVGLTNLPTGVRTANSYNELILRVHEVMH